MCSQNCQKNIKLHDGFTITEKILLPGLWYVYVAIGAYAIFAESITWGLIYLAFCTFGFFVGILYTLCAHCPYPYEYSDCLFFPHKFIKKLYRHRPGPLTMPDKTGLWISLLGTVILPQYWLLNNASLLILFWVFCIPAWASLPLYLCKKCRNFECPINKAGKEYM
jgi:hypothetical protein